MCARFSLKTSANVLAELFELDEVPEVPIRYNVAPQEMILAVASPRHWAWLQWGLVPAWADDPSIGRRLINARAETIHEKPAFRAAYRYRRCLIPADGFFEWQEPFNWSPRTQATDLFGEPTSPAQPKSKAKDKPRKQPFCFRRKDQRPFALAGVWDEWERPEGLIQSCAVLTTEPNLLMAPIHDRMPVILSPEDWDLWLAPEPPKDRVRERLTRPWDPQGWEVFPVTHRMSNPRYDHPDAVEPLGA